MGLTTLRPSQKHVIATEVFLITDTGCVEESASEHSESASVDTFSEEIMMTRNVAKRCSCRLYVTHVDVAQQRGASVRTPWQRTPC